MIGMRRVLKLALGPADIFVETRAKNYSESSLKGKELEVTLKRQLQTQSTGRSRCIFL